MIVFDRLWATMKAKGISQYRLIKEFNFSTGQLDRLRKNENVNTYTLDLLCRILNCKLEDIAEFRRENEHSTD
ncbi:MAG: helix-turn-helix transcriptional regulator [Clostridia bacterium]|nr:helix-turn-helix transcriptional regulator [Clostridia bacterium]